MTNFEIITKDVESLARNLIYYNCLIRGYSISVNEEIFDNDGDSIAGFNEYDDALRFAIEWLNKQNNTN